MSRLPILLASAALSLALAGCDDKSSDDDDDDDDFSSDSGQPDWTDGADGGGGSGDGGDGGDGGSGDGGDGGGDGGDGGGGGNPMPVEGTWSVTGYDLVSDVCGLAAFQDPGALLPATMTVAHTGSASFTVSGDGGDPSACEAEASGAYRCSPATVEQSLSDFGLDGTLVIDNSLSGTTSSDGLDWGVLTTVEINCEGSDCGIVEALGLSFPCTQELDLVTDAP